MFRHQVKGSYLNAFRNAAAGLARHSVNAAAQLPIGQTERKEAARKMRPDLQDVLSTLLRIFLIDISATPHALALIRLANAASLFLPVLPTPLRGYCFAVRQNERQLPYGSGKTKGELLLHSQQRCKVVPAVRQNARRHLSHLNARKYQA